MSTREIRRRVERLEQRFPKKDPTGYTLEEHARKMWREDRADYMRRVQQGCWWMNRLIPQFESEEARHVGE